MADMPLKTGAGDAYRMASHHPKVLYLLGDPGIPLYSSLKAGGVHARAMIHAFLEEGAEVDVVALRGGKGKDLLPESARVELARRSSLRRRWDRYYRYRATPLWAAGIQALLAQGDFLATARKALADTRPPDLIYARHSWLSYALPRIQSLTQAPLYLEVNALFAQEKSERGELAFPGLTRRLEAWTLRRATRILPVSRALEDAITGMGLPRARIRVSSNAVDLDLFDARLRENVRSDEPNGFTIGLASSFRHYHGIKTLIEAVHLLEDRAGPMHLKLIGDGPMRSGIEGWAKEAGLKSRLEITGPVPHAEIPRLLAACDVCVAPYEGDRNLYNCPMKLFEYMALKIPIVASRWGEIPRILEHERTALLHDPASPRSLAVMLERVIVDPESAERRTAAAFEQVQKQTWRGHARSILDEAAEAKRQGN